MTYEEFLATELDASEKIKCIEEAFGVFQDTPEENDSSQSLQEAREKEALAESECEIIHVYPNANQAPTLEENLSVLTVEEQELLKACNAFNFRPKSNFGF